VRGLQFVGTGGDTQGLVSTGEDCTIKLWDAKKFATLKEPAGVTGSAESQLMNMEPYLTIRGHRRPVTALSGKDLLFPMGSATNIVVSGTTNG
jgi:WD40 repeat protein